MNIFAMRPPVWFVVRRKKVYSRTILPVHRAVNMQYTACMRQDTLLTRIGSLVRTRRTSMGWTLREIAERSGVSSRFLSDLESGKGNISVSRLADVARALDVPLVSLMPSEEKQSTVVALVGLRGAGKSTVGKALAKHLDAPLFELDALIEKQANLKLGELFALHGESYYKRLAYD